jgi:hypothetical protein
MRKQGPPSSLLIVGTVMTACFSDSPTVGIVDTEAFETTGELDPVSSTATDGRVDDETTAGLDETTAGLDETTVGLDETTVGLDETTGPCMPGVFGASHLGDACFQ